ncbi:MAG: pitrilysin family protein [Acidobacteriota bacterium]
MIIDAHWNYLDKLKVEQSQLKNGLKIFMLENHSLPIISFYTFLKAGSRNEKSGTTGISHFLEHMMFNGSEKYGPKEFDLKLESNGGYSNAYTSNDWTAYFEEFPPSALELVIDMESDRISKLLLDRNSIESERGVIKEERRLRTENYPAGKLEEELYAISYNSHPYQWPVIGWMRDLDSIKYEDLKYYYSTYYSPNNAFIVIVGDFNSGEVFELIKRHYENIPLQQIPERKITLDEEQLGERRAKVTKDVEVSSFMIGYHVPDCKNSDVYALDLLQIILAGGKSSRLYQEMILKKMLAISVSIDFPWRIDPSLFIFYVQMRPDKENREGEEIIYREIENVRENGVREGELQKAKNIILTGFIKNFQTNNSTANVIGTYEILFGSWEKIKETYKNYDRITYEDIKKVVEKYFNERNRNVVEMLPEKKNKK